MRNGWRTASVALAAALVALVVQSAIAGPSTTVSGKSVSAVKVVRETNVQTISSTTLVDVAGASTTITVPSKGKAIILARFSAESVCSGGAPSPGTCSVRILIGGVEAEPAAGSDFAFDGTDNGTEGQYSFASHSMDRSRGPLGPGTYTVRVQATVSTVGIVFRLDDWSLTVERVSV